MDESVETAEHARRLKLAGIAAAVALVAVYGALFGRYRLENVDDAWTLAWAHNFINRGIETDLVFYDGQGGGVYAFGKLYCMLYGPLLNAIGWTKAHAHGISIGLTCAALLFWYLALRRIGYDRRLCFTFVVILGLIEPVFAMANMARVDAIVFLLVAVSFYAFAAGFFLPAGLAAILAVENHPIGCVAFLYMAALALARLKPGLERKRVIAGTLLLGVGAMLGVVVYVALHYKSLGAAAGSVAYNVRASFGIPNFLYHYYFKTKYLRHVPELVITVAAFALYLARRFWRDDRFPLLAALALAASSFLIRRANFHYAVFAYPAFVLLWVYVGERWRRPTALLGLVLVLLLPQYGLVAYRHRHESAAAFEQYAADLRLAVPSDATPVVGSANEWFAFTDREFYHHRLFEGDRFDVCYLIAEEELRESGQLDAIRQTHELEPVDTPDLKPYAVTVYRAVLNPRSGSGSPTPSTRR